MPLRKPPMAGLSRDIRRRCAGITDCSRWPDGHADRHGALEQPRLRQRVCGKSEKPAERTHTGFSGSGSPGRILRASICAASSLRKPADAPAALRLEAGLAPKTAQNGRFRHRRRCPRFTKAEAKLCSRSPARRVRRHYTGTAGQVLAAFLGDSGRKGDRRSSFRRLRTAKSGATKLMPATRPRYKDVSSGPVLWKPRSLHWGSGRR